jgi:hypothetical protein
MINLPTTSHSAAQHHLLVVASNSQITARDIKKYTGATWARRLPHQFGFRFKPRFDPFFNLTFAYQLSCLVTGDKKRFGADIYVLSGNPTSIMLLLSQFGTDIYARVKFNRTIAIEFIRLAGVGHEIMETRHMFQKALERTVKNNKAHSYCQKHGLMYPILDSTTENDISSIGQIELDHYTSRIRQLLAPSW